MIIKFILKCIALPLLLPIVLIQWIGIFLNSISSVIFGILSGICTLTAIACLAFGLSTGGENLYPVQIEDFIRANPAVKDVAVIGLPDARLGEIAAALVSVKEGMALSEQQLNDFCLGLPRYKRPRKIIFAEVPRNPTGKIEKPKLRKMYGAADLIAKQNGIALVDGESRNLI